MIFTHSPVAVFCGPIALQWYGIMIAAAATVGYFLLLHDHILKKFFTADQLSNFTSFIILQAVFGGRILWFFEQNLSAYSWTQKVALFFTVWSGGFSILGTISAVALTLPLYVIYCVKAPLAVILDRLTLYAPLIQAISRIGCLLAGCCCGVETDSWYGIIYTHQDSLAPLLQTVHPTQLYSSILLTLLFVGLYLLQRKIKTPGILTSLYLVGAGLERFLVDFLRADRTLIGGWLSSTQYIACGLMITGLIAWYCGAYGIKRK